MERLHAHRAQRIDFIEDDVLASGPAPESADFVISTLRAQDLQPRPARAPRRARREGAETGRRVRHDEASDPRGWWLRPLYRFHLKVALPLIERMVLRGAQDFAMIGTYSTTFGAMPPRFAQMLRAEGLEAEYRRFFFGCATAGWAPALTHDCNLAVCIRGGA